ncbi:hypothetical protein ACFL3S_00065 [Gemmatimonadota bacterium]
MLSRNRMYAFLALLVVSPLCASCGGGSDPGAGGAEDVFATLERAAAYPEPFSFLNGVREMPDGTLLAADPLSQVLLRLDLGASTADTLGQVGGGPDEYRQPDQVFPLPADSTLLVDLGKALLTVIGPDGVFHEGMQMARPAENGRLTVIMPRFVDEQGGLYFTGSRGMGQGPPDSTALLRFDRALDQLDTVATLWVPELQVTRSGGNVSVVPRMMEPRDEWAVGMDGSLVVVRASDYSVEWYHPDGQVVVGPPNAFETFSIGDSDKEAFLEDMTSGGITMMMTASQGGATSMQMSRGGGMGGGDGPSPADFEWAEVFPPFQPNRTLVSPDGHAWVQSWLPLGEQPRMEVFDHQGARAGHVEMPLSSRILGFGNTPDGGEVAYIVRTDDVGLRWLEQYRVVKVPG